MEYTHESLSPLPGYLDATPSDHPRWEVIDRMDTSQEQDGDAFLLASFVEDCLGAGPLSDAYEGTLEQGSDEENDAIADVLRVASSLEDYVGAYAAARVAWIWARGKTARNFGRPAQVAVDSFTASAFGYLSLAQEYPATQAAMDRLKANRPEEYDMDRVATAIFDRVGHGPRSFRLLGNYPEPGEQDHAALVFVVSLAAALSNSMRLEYAVGIAGRWMVGHHDS